MAVTDEQIFLGEAFENYLLRQARRCCDKKGICLKVGRFPQLPNMGGWTDGTQITINAASSMVGTYPKTELKVLGMIGTVAHECGHINYTDMEKRRLYAKGIQNGILYPQMPKPSKEQEEISLRQLKECLFRKEEKQLAVLKDTLLMLHNILEDIFIEARQCVRYGGIVRKAIRFAGRWGTERAASIRQMEVAGLGELAIMEQVILLYLRAGKINDWEKAGEKYQNALEDCKEILQEAVKSFDPDSRFMAANQILLPLWPFLLKEFEREGRLERRMAEYEGPVSGKPWERAVFEQPSEAEREGMQQALRKMRSARRITGAKELGKRMEKIRNKTAAASKTSSAAPASPAFSSTKSRNVSDSAFGRGVIGKEKGFGAKSFGRQTEAVPLSGIHQGHTLYFNREEPGPLEWQAYEREKKEILETAGRMVQRLRPFLAEPENGWERGLARGKRVSQKGFGRRDGRIFGRRNVPGEQKPLAVTVLLDESGSMICEGRIDAAKRTALVLYHFCRRLRIPIRILGHSTGRRGTGPESVELYGYTDFDSGDGKEEARLMRVRSRDCNRDGAALAYAGEELMKRTEEGRILIVVTDGCPWGQNYTGENAILDTREVRRKLTYKGIRVIAAAIGDDREDIERIYGRDFWNISDVKRLPDALASLIGTYLERWT